MADSPHEAATFLNLLERHRIRLGYHLTEPSLTRRPVRDQPTAAILMALTILIKYVVVLGQLLLRSHSHKVLVRQMEQRI